MLTRTALSLTRVRGVLSQSLRRNIAVSAVACQKAATVNLDPIQKLFLDKVRDYDTKSKATGGKLVDATADTEKKLNDYLERLKTQYGASSADFLNFPSFSFTDPTLEPVGVSGEAKESTEEVEAAVEEAQDDDTPFWKLPIGL